MNNRIKKYLQSYQLLSPTEIDAFLELSTRTSLKKGMHLIREGEVSKHIAFIESGILRSYYYSSESEEVTYCFIFQDTLVTAYTSWITQQASQENLQALTDMELILISRAQLDQLEATYPNWIRFFKRVAENEYINLERRIFLLQRESAETRYQDLLEKHPEYLHDIPLRYLASYLGVTQRHLSRIRKNLVF